MLSIKAFKSNFFDRDRIVDAIAKSNRVALSRAGSEVRTVARGSMKRQKGAALPGQPPAVHEGQLRRFLFFAYDESSKSVIVGSAKLGKGEAPSIMEFGGRAAFVVKERGRDERGRFTGRARRTKTRKQIKARPYMRPALKRVAPKIPALWANSIG